MNFSDIRTIVGYLSFVLCAPSVLTPCCCYYVSGFMAPSCRLLLNFPLLRSMQLDRIFCVRLTHNVVWVSLVPDRIANFVNRVYQSVNEFLFPCVSHQID